MGDGKVGLRADGDDSAAKPLKLNLGSGISHIPGYVAVDHRRGGEAVPLKYPDDSVAEIRASHLLEHFSHQRTPEILCDWIRALEPGGLLRIAVPNFTAIVKRYHEPGHDDPIEAWLMGGQGDEDDFHRSIFNEQKLRGLLEAAGLEQIEPWTTEVGDCASLPISLNLQGRKPMSMHGQPAFPVVQPASAPKPTTYGPRDDLHVSAVMSIPRLGFQDNFFAAFQAFLPLKIGLKKVSGAFWGQCLERGMEQTVEEGAGAILTLDYDSVFTVDDVRRLCELFAAHPEIDALAPVQIHRHTPYPMMTIQGDDGKNRDKVAMEELQQELLQVTTAHFGLTLIRTEKLKAMKKPWFHSRPGPDGRWDEGRVDDDIWFWRWWHKLGNTLYLAPRVVIGHAELMIGWPGRPGPEAKAVWQTPKDFWENGKPKDAWQ